MFAPRIIERISKLKDAYDPRIIDALYNWPLPVCLCEKKLFEKMVTDIITDHFDKDYYENELHKRLRLYVKKL